MILPLLFALGGQALGTTLAGSAAGAIGTGLAAAAGSGLGNAVGQLIQTGEVDPRQALLSAAGAGVATGFAPATGAAAGAPGGLPDVAQAAYPGQFAMADPGITAITNPSGIAAAAPAGGNVWSTMGDAAKGLGNAYLNGSPASIIGGGMQMMAADNPGWRADEQEGNFHREQDRLTKAFERTYAGILTDKGIPQSAWGNYGFGPGLYQKPKGFQTGGVHTKAPMPKQEEEFTTPWMAWDELYGDKRPFWPSRIIAAEIDERNKVRPSGGGIASSMEGKISRDRQEYLRNQLFNADMMNTIQDSIVRSAALPPREIETAFKMVVGRDPKPGEVQSIKNTGGPGLWSELREIQRMDKVRPFVEYQPDPNASMIENNLGAVQNYTRQRGYATGGVVEENLGLGLAQTSGQVEGDMRSKEMQKIFDLLVVALMGELPEQEAQAIIELATQTLGPDTVEEVRAQLAAGNGPTVVGGEPSLEDNVVAQDAQTGQPIKLASGEAILPTGMVEAAGGGLAGAQNIVQAAAQNMPQLQPHAAEFSRSAHT